ncbi:MAG: AlbA family DNA-binding domain-containing protein [Thermoleophilia bacterium]
MAGYIEQYFDKAIEDVTYADLKSFLDQRVEEHQTLEYKPRGILVRENDTVIKPSSPTEISGFVALAKTVAGFANAEGGLLILGVKERAEKHRGTIVKMRPGALSPLPATVSREMIENQLLALIQYPIENIVIKALHPGPRSMKTIYLIDVPQSRLAPHRVNELRYYQRYNFSTLEMKHFQIEDIFGGRQLPVVSASFGHQKRHTPDPHSLHKYQLVIKLSNVGRSMASYVGLDFEFPQEALRDENSPPYKLQIDNSYSEIKRAMSLIKYRNNPNEDGKAPLFPGETIRVTPNNFLGGHLNYHINNAIHNEWEYKEFLVRIYADIAPVIESTFKFSDISNF